MNSLLGRITGVAAACAMAFALCLSACTSGLFFDTDFYTLELVLIGCAALAGLVGVCGVAALRFKPWMLAPFMVAAAFALLLAMHPESVKGTEDGFLRWTAYGSWTVLLGLLLADRRRRVAGWAAFQAAGAFVVLGGWAGWAGLIDYRDIVFRSDASELASTGARLAGFLQYPNTYGAVVAALTLVQWQLLRSGRRAVSAYAAFALVPCLSSLLLTESRGAMLSLAFGLALSLALGKREERGRGMAAAGVSLMLAAGVASFAFAAMRDGHPGPSLWVLAVGTVVGGCALCALDALSAKSAQWRANGTDGRQAKNPLSLPVGRGLVSSKGNSCGDIKEGSGNVEEDDRLGDFGRRTGAAYRAEGGNAAEDSVLGDSGWRPGVTCEIEGGDDEEGKGPSDSGQSLGAGYGAEGCVDVGGSVPGDSGWRPGATCETEGGNDEEGKGRSDSGQRLGAGYGAEGCDDAGGSVPGDSGWRPGATCETEGGDDEEGKGPSDSGQRLGAGYGAEGGGRKRGHQSGFEGWRRTAGAVVARLHSFPGGLLLLLIGMVAAYLLLIGSGNAPSGGGESRLNGNLETAASRQLYYADALRMIRDRPWFGAGGEGWRMLVGLYQTRSYTAGEVHSGYLDVLVDVGLVGLLALLAFLVGYAARLWKSRASAWGPAAVLLAHAAIDFDWSYGYIWLLLLAWLALHMSAAEADTAAAGIRLRRFAPTPRWAAPLCAALLLGFAAAALPAAWRSASAVRERSAALAEPYARESHLRAALAANPEWTRIRLELVPLLPGAERESLLAAGLRYEPHSPPLELQLGITAAELGEAAAARDYFREGLRLVRFDREAQNAAIAQMASLADRLANAGREDEARVAASAAVEFYENYRQLYRDTYAGVDNPWDDKQRALFVGAKVNAARAMILLGQSAEAKEILQEVSEENAPDWQKQANDLLGQLSRTGR